MFYEPKVATLCDICEGEDCGTTCSEKSSSQSNQVKQSSDATKQQSLFGYMSIILAFFLQVRLLHWFVVVVMI